MLTSFLLLFSHRVDDTAWRDLPSPACLAYGLMGMDGPVVLISLSCPYYNPTAAPTQTISTTIIKPPP